MQASFETYGNYSSGNYGAHALVFTDATGADYYYSYRTLVAFRAPGVPLVVRVNEWGPTTGKHLNWIDGGSTEAKRARVSGDRLAEIVAEYADRAAVPA